MPTEPRNRRVAEWINDLSGGVFSIAAGQFVESPSNAKQMFLVVRRGGGAVNVSGEFLSFEAVMLSGRGDRIQGGQIEKIIDAIAKYIRDMSQGTPNQYWQKVLPCGAAGVRLVGSAAGPNYTLEDRAYYSFVLEFTY